MNRAQKALFNRCKNVQERAERKGYTFGEIELGMFSQLGRVEWDEDRVHWIIMDTLERTEDRVKNYKRRASR